MKFNFERKWNENLKKRDNEKEKKKIGKNGWKWV